MSLHALMVASGRKPPIDPVVAAVMEAIPVVLRRRIDSLRSIGDGACYFYRADITSDHFKEVIGDLDGHSCSPERIVVDAFSRFLAEHPIWEGMQLYGNRYRVEAELYADWSEAVEGYGREVRTSFETGRPPCSPEEQEQIVAAGVEALKCEYRKHLIDSYPKLASQGHQRAELVSKEDIWNEDFELSLPEEAKLAKISFFPGELIRRFLIEMTGSASEVRFYLEEDTVWVDWSEPPLA